MNRKDFLKTRIMEGMGKKSGTKPMSDKEKSLAALAHPKDKITHKDVLVGRGVLKKEEVEQVDEVKGGPPPEAYPSDTRVIKTPAKPKSGVRKRSVGSFNKYGVWTPGVRYEEVEQIDEISKTTLKSYSTKAEKQTRGNQPHGTDALRKRTNREKGLKSAYNKYYGYKTKIPATEEVEQVAEASYSAKAARAGKDIGKPGKMFANIAASAAKKYGSEERGKKVAGAVLKKLRAKQAK